MKKTAIIIPGFGEHTSEVPYREIKKIALREGYIVKTYNPRWSRNTASNWIAGFKELFQDKDLEQATIIGFSFGAYIAILIAQSIKAHKIIACSLSPYFKEDIATLPPIAHKILGTRRMSDFKRHSFPRSIKNVAYIVGDADFPQLIVRVKKAYKRTGGKKRLTIIKKVAHEISQAYLRAIEKELRRE